MEQLCTLWLIQETSTIISTYPEVYFKIGLGENCVLQYVYNIFVFQRSAK